jgi:stage V sporulation protein D (sporulation-specific penicillin-binding protein)
VILYTDESATPAEITVPDVIGMSGQQANRMILNSGLNIRITGMDIENTRCIAAAQDPAAGTKVEEGTVVTVTFEAGEAVQ